MATSGICLPYRLAALSVRSTQRIPDGGPTILFACSSPMMDRRTLLAADDLSTA
jgi:hypothetical protein